MAAPRDGGVTIWSPTQHPFVLQRVVAQVLDLPVPAVRVIAPDPGGGFGGKGYPKFEPLLATLALQTGRPVRLVLSLEESFQASRRAACRVQMRTGFDRQGSLCFQDMQADFLIGAYADIADRVVSKASYTATGPYRTPHARVLARGLFSHTTPSTAFRGFGVPQLTWALELQMDAAARQLGIDRLEIRLRNLARKGEALFQGDTPVDGDWEQSLRKAAGSVGWGRPLEPGRGRGIAIGIKASATVSVSNVIVRLHYDGSASVLMGTADMGQGARTVMTQFAAGALGISPESVHVITGRYLRGPLRLVHLGQPRHGLYGQRGFIGLPGYPAPAPRNRRGAVRDPGRGRRSIRGAGLPARGAADLRGRIERLLWAFPR